MIKICVGVIQLYENDGVGNTVFGQARELSKRHDVTLFTQRTDVNDYYGIPVRKMAMRTPMDIKSVARLLDAEKYEAAISHMYPFNLIADVSHVPHLMIDYGSPPFKYIRDANSVLAFFQYNLSRCYSVRRAEQFAPISHYIARKVMDVAHHRRPYKVVHTGIEYPALDEIVEPSGLDGRPIVLYVGNHTVYKNVHTLMRVFGRARDRLKGDGISPRLITIGRVPRDDYGQMLRLLARKIGDIELKGIVEDIWPYYKAASVYASCSQWEGEDRPALEAQGLGLPVVAFDIGSHPEVIKHGRCVHTDREFEDALVDILSHPNKFCNAEDLRREYSLEKSGLELSRILEEI